MTEQQSLRVLGLARVSTTEQSEHGISLDAQESAIRAYCVARGWNCAGVTRDVGSGKDLRRDGLQRALDELGRKQRSFDLLLVVKLDRLSRSVSDLHTLMERFRKAGVAFTSISESVDTSTASGQFFFTLLGALAELERQQIGERTRAALQHLKRQGRRVSGRAPFGFEFTLDGRVVPFPSERRVLEQIRELREGGATLASISATLARRGHVNRSGRAFSVSALSLLCQRQASAFGIPTAPCEILVTS